jgi:Trypsin-co-occurring domain 1
MDFSKDHSETVPVQLPNGSIIKVEATTSGREDVSFSAKEFQPIADAIEGIVQMIATPIQKAKPKKAIVKFGMEIAVESGQLTAIIIKGSGKANLEITLEW